MTLSGLDNSGEVWRDLEGGPSQAYIHLASISVCL